ncbi:MAG: hypothetical protein AAB552_00070 [Patescibacteria group bacterium]
MDTNNDKKIQKIQAAAEGIIVVAVVLAVLTIVGELWAPLKNTLKSIFTHHWLGKSALSIIFFAVIFLIRSNMHADMTKLPRKIYAAVWISALSAFAMTAFFIAHTLHLF